jgi:HEAT repeat protein
MYGIGYFKLFLIIIIISVVSVIAILICTAFLRRILRGRKYRELDEQRESYRVKLRKSFDSGNISQEIPQYLSPPKSIKWLALEEILFDFMAEARYREIVKDLFQRLGYVAFYENKLKSANSIARSFAIDKLGNMLSKKSSDKLINMLKSKNEEIISVTWRSLSRMGSLEDLKKMLEHLPEIFEKGLISKKLIVATCINFGKEAVPIFLEYGRKYEDPRLVAIVFEVLFHFEAKSIVSFAIDNLTNNDAEIRAKAIKSIITNKAYVQDVDKEHVVKLLSDPVWFVRLQAVKALGNIQHHDAADIVGNLLLDENWQVRNTSATVLTKMGDISLDVFLKTLRSNDLYAKECICEEIEKTNLANTLIENLVSDNKDVYEKSKEILLIMNSLNFSTPLLEYHRKGANEKIKNEVNILIHKGSSI